MSTHPPAPRAREHNGPALRVHASHAAEPPRASTPRSTPTRWQLLGEPVRPSVAAAGAPVHVRLQGAIGGRARGDDTDGRRFRGPDLAWRSAIGVRVRDVRVEL